MAFTHRVARMVLPVVAGGLLFAAPSCRAREAVEMQSEADTLILQSFLKHAEAEARRVTPEAVAKIEEAEEICWVWSNYVRLPLAAYALTGETRYLDQFARAMDALLGRLREGPDGHRGFRGLPLPLFRDPAHPDAQIEVDIAEFEIAHLLCDFIEYVNADPALKAPYGDKAAHYLAIAENHLAGPKWEARKLYMDLGDEGAIFRMPAKCGNNRDHLTNPHNKQSKMCRAYLALYRVTGKDDYFRKAVKLGVRFKRTLRLEGDRYRWNYWDPAGDWDRKPDKPGEWKHWIGPEHRGGYHALTVAMAEALYDHGVVFDRADMQRFVNTQMQLCWNGSLEAPIFQTTGGKPVKEAAHGTVMAPSLARFEPKVWEFCYGERATRERLDKRAHGWSGGVQAVGYLLGKYQGTRAPEPVQTRYRDQFAAKPENARFLRQMEYQVVTPERRDRK